MKTVRLIGVAAALLLLAGCAAGTADASQAASAGLVSQLVLGFWHGIIAPLTLLVEVIRRFLPGVIPWPWHMFETGSTSVAYDIGFYFGITSGPSFLFFRRRR